MSPIGPDAEDFRRLRDEIVTEVRELRQALEAGFVRKEVQEAREYATNQQLKGMEDELHVIVKRLDAADDRARKATSARWSLAFSAVAGPILVVVMLHAMGLLASAK